MTNQSPDVQKILVEIRPPDFLTHRPAPLHIYSTNVFSVEHGDRRFVIKELIAESKEFLSVILEAEMLIKNIRQDNVIRYYGLHVAGCIGGKVHYLLALGHCTGGNLLEWAIQSRFRQNFEHRKIGRILRDVLRGLDYLHQHDLQLIHCDIKPQNLVLHMPEGRIVIIDFEGVAVGRQLKSEKVTNAYTPSYAAPELLRVLGDIDDNQEEISGKIDVWSVGCVGIVLITGKAPVICEWRDGGEGAVVHKGITPVMFHVGRRLAKPKLPPLDRKVVANRLR